MTENEILELKLKPRSLSEKRLVEIFATPSIYERYKNNGRFIGSDKKRVLERASKFCKIRDDESYCAGAFAFVITVFISFMLNGKFVFTEEKYSAGASPTYSKSKV